MSYTEDEQLWLQENDLLGSDVTDEQRANALRNWAAAVEEVHDLIQGQMVERAKEHLSTPIISATALLDQAIYKMPGSDTGWAWTDETIFLSTVMDYVEDVLMRIIDSGQDFL